MKILAIDPGTKCGWALSPIESGVWDLKHKRHEGSGMRIVILGKFLNEILAAHPDLEMLCYEEVRRHLGTSAAHIYGEITGKLKEWGELHKIAYMAVPVGTLKTHATGKGNAKKDAMIEAAQAKWPEIEIVDDNHADALWIWDYAQTEYGAR